MLFLTNYLFIKQDYIVETWDISVTGSKVIWEMKPVSTSDVSSVCPLWDGDRVLVGHCSDVEPGLEEFGDHSG